MNPFDCLNAINVTKEPIVVDEVTEKQYPAFMVNRGLSYFPDTLFLANELNLYHEIPNRWKADFLLLSVSKKKRFSKWASREKPPETVELVKQYFGYNTERAVQALTLLTDEDLAHIEGTFYKGGKLK